MKMPIVIDYSLYISGVYEIRLGEHSDERGRNVEGFNRELYNRIPSFPTLFTWKVDSFSFSKQGALRGFHGDAKNWKLIQCLQGSIQFVVIDKRANSKTLDNSIPFLVHGEDNCQFLLPPGVVNAHLCVSENCIFFYKLSSEYVGPEEQIHVKWNDPRYNINWLNKNPILSERDK